MLFAEEIFHIGSFPVTNAMLTSWVAVLVLVLFAWIVRNKMKVVPGRIQQGFELVLEGGLNLCDQVTGDRKLSERIFPISISVFFFILINNWLGLLPFGAFGIMEHGTFIPFLRSGTADLNTTLALGIFAVVGANIFAIISLGAWKAGNKYLNFIALRRMVKDVKKNPTGLIVEPVHFFVGIVEIMGEIAKIASLSFRLFGNVFAGEVLLAAMTALAAYIIPTPFMFLEIMVGFIQALIFAMLVTVYFSIAAHDHNDEGAHEQH
jgi:F-type H+-transporting ATPase subunit a